MRDYSDETQHEIEAALLEHARLGLKRVHTVCNTRNRPQTECNPKADDDSKTTPLANDKTKKQVPSEPVKKVTKINYLSTKKPVEKSVYYQHSRQGMKYWFEEEKSKSYNSKVPIGRKGTLLGLVDAPLK